MLLLVIGRRRAHKNCLAHALLELVKLQWPVIQRRGQAETVIDQVLLARAVATVHATHLTNSHVRFINKDQRVIRQVVDQRRRRFSGLATGEMPGVVFDALAETNLAQHLDIELGALLDALCFHQLGFSQKRRLLDIQLVLDAFDGTHHRCARRHVVTRRIHREARQPLTDLAGQRIKQLDALDLVIKELDSNGMLGMLGRKHIDHITPHAEGATLEVHLVTGVLHLGQPLE